MEEGVRAVSAATATLIAGGLAIVGTLLGAVMGLFADRLLQRQGEVRCVIEMQLSVRTYEMGEVEWSKEQWTVALDPILPIPADLFGDRLEGSIVTFRLNVRFFNEKEVRTGLRNVVVVFDAKPPVESPPLRYWSEQNEKFEVVNLPSREWVALSLHGNITKEDALRLTECKKAWLRGYFPNDRRFSQQIPVGSGRHTTPWRVDSITPSGLYVRTDFLPKITFSKDMDPTTINTDTFKLLDRNSGEIVPGGVDYDEPTKVATFTPAAPLQMDGQYTLTLTTGIKDKAGNARDEDYNWDFKVY